MPQPPNLHGRDEPSNARRSESVADVEPAQEPVAARLRVLVVNWQDWLHPCAGGAEVHLRQIFGRLAARGHTVTLIASGWPGAPQRVRLDGIDVHRVGSRRTFWWRAPVYCRQLLARTPYDVLVEDLNKLPLYAPRWAGRPVLLLAHHLFGAAAFQASTFPVAALTWLAERSIGPFYRGVRVQAVSWSTAREFLARSFRADEVRVVPNGVNLAYYTPDPSCGRTPEPQFAYVGRLRRYKRVDLLLRALARLTRSGVSARLIIAGTGTEEPALRRLARRLGVIAQIEFAGFISNAAKLELFRRSWAHLLTSAKEGWGLSVLEAGACGTPTIASNSPGLREAVVHGLTGMLVPHGDVVALADAMASIARDRALVERLGSGARWFAETFTWERAADATERNLRALAAGEPWPRDDATALYHRDPQSRIAVPRTGAGSAPFGCSRYLLEFVHDGIVRRLVATIGAMDPGGRRPVLVIEELHAARSVGAESSVELASGTSVPLGRHTPGPLASELLAGWPRDESVFLTHHVATRFPGASDVRVRRWPYDGSAEPIVESS
jgi:glycosyltransferase involved in cell wall biosynthesis